jgi:SUMO ligase MMS21 Smc5/6 complex component
LVERETADVGEPERLALWAQYVQIRDSDDAGAAAGEIDEDAELVVASAALSIKCPITQKVFVDPVMSKKCRHNYERDAITRHVRSSRGRATLCPVAGCSERVTLDDLTPNPAMLREIQKQEAASRATLRHVNEL